MKTWGEITEKIRELQDMARETKEAYGHEMLCNQIDALLWVIEDRSGKEI